MTTSDDSMLNLKGLSASASDDNNMQSSNTFVEVLYYSSLILFLPIFSFFLTKHAVLQFALAFDPMDVSTNVMSAIVAVIVLHLALGLFIYKAYFEGTPAKKRIGKQE